MGLDHGLDRDILRAEVEALRIPRRIPMPVPVLKYYFKELTVGTQVLNFKNVGTRSHLKPYL